MTVNSQETIYFKGQMQKQSNELLNRAVFFGENAFTCLRLVNGRYESLELHLERLKKSYEFLFDKSFVDIEKEITTGLESIKKEKGTFYIRITFLKFLTDEIDFFIIKRKLDEDHRKEVLNEELNVCFSSFKKTRSVRPSFLKLGNYADVLLELKELKKKNIQDVLYLNQEEQLTEASMSNVFLVKDNKVLTPRISYGVLEGTFREKLISFLSSSDYEIEEREITREEVLEASEIWLSNAIKGLRPVDTFEGQKLSKICYNEVNEKFTLYMSN